MLFSNCKSMRWLVMLAGFFFFTGIGLYMLSNLFELEEIFPSIYVSYTAFFLVLSGPALLLSTVVLVLLPGRRERFDSCEH